MTKSFSRRLFLSGALSALAAAGHAGAPAVSLRPQLRPEGLTAAKAPPRPPEAQDLIDAARLNGKVAYAVIDMRTGATLEARNGATGMPPASVTKSITALYALDALGPTYRFETRLVATGPVDAGIIQGDLVLVGGGDPVLDTDALADMAADLKAAGIRGLTGDFRVFGGALPFERFIDAGQPDQVGYNPAVSGLNLNFNRVHFQWVRAADGYTVTMDARSAKYRPEVQVARMMIADRSTPLYTYADGGDHDQWTVARAALGKSGARWLPVRYPDSYAGEVFASVARAQGITLERAKRQDSAPSGATLVSHLSDPLPEILRGMLKYSNNLTAELVGMTATVARTGSAETLADSAREMTAWARADLGLEGATLVDHSGLGAASRISPRALARGLAAAGRHAALKPMLKPFKMRNADGQPDDAHPILVEAKTGTLHFVSALAGYATGPSGRPLAFAIFAHDPDSRVGLENSTDDRPPGAATWNRRAKTLQQALIERWDAAYGS
ncbi:D-alanyl-D-alanine carboxypeptidase/D-alanyl-D-alanine-endopeptidase [Pelagivirga sediminicola]|uniref:D-alanyl-D-alanine carboxypeptidase/D-alanyl-D-alanine-endopeptidase n=1 Tax=Pelagivirga sediminicola TaxID=2170575 RepID=A0A2T7G901_9RHOB|nr:D-alanyl-D-alanine carboxypeptidase/D-alanyl-D-alanine-endopeptidase [Pelagivirga sediminicola]PVA10893.1 D-alanyl-D-alanine carboxypeptidase/D-alanyl-D-alanine-endopeptidase [Pelagivirga sediminicola]